jgi:hypothetical protein
MSVHRGSIPVVQVANLLDGSPSIANKVQELGKSAKGDIEMRIMTFVLVATVACFIAGGQALAAKRTSSSGVVNPDRQLYQQAGSCGGGSCYRSSSQKHQKKK